MKHYAVIKKKKQESYKQGFLYMLEIINIIKDKEIQYENIAFHEIVYFLLFLNEFYRQTQERIYINYTTFFLVKYNEYMIEIPVNVENNSLKYTIEDITNLFSSKDDNKIFTTELRLFINNVLHLYNCIIHNIEFTEKKPSCFILFNQLDKVSQNIIMLFESISDEQISAQINEADEEEQLLLEQEEYFQNLQKEAKKKNEIIEDMNEKKEKEEEDILFDILQSINV
jgi:hypothetical protein